MKSLVLAEKPSVAKDIARVLHCHKTQSGAIEGEKYVITWGYGHLVELSDPEAYNKNYKEWRLDDLPMIPEAFQLEVIKKTAKQFQIVKNLIFRKDIKEIIIATDAGREGELVARLILEKAKNNKPLKRLWISSVTDKAILDGFEKLKDGKAYQKLYDAAKSRAEADWLVGINATRALTCKYNAQLSCGRVQTPTLAMIAKREEEIKNFVPKTYYMLKAEGSIQNIAFLWQDSKTKAYHSYKKERITQLLEELKGCDGVVTEVETTAKKVTPPLLYDLTELQRDAHKRYQYSPKETLSIMQRLYEAHKVLTYPRTDSRYLSSDIIPTLKERLKAISIGPYKEYAKQIIQKPISKQASFVNDKKVTDHHAIIPTDQSPELTRMSVEERRIYDLVIRRFLAVLYPPFEYNQITVTIMIKNESFLAKGRQIKNDGWKVLYENFNQEEDNDSDMPGQNLPDLKKGDLLTKLQLILSEGRTKPPSPFNEATLLSAMENPTAFLSTKDEGIRKTLGETGGLGTVATRADIIEKLYAGYMIEKRGRDLYLTAKAKQLLQLVPEDLKKPELTADWEKRLYDISQGKLDYSAFMEDIRGYTKDIVGEIKAFKGAFRHDNITNRICPSCGKRMLAVKGKNSEMLLCQDRTCGHKEILSRTTNARCPVCHKKMNLFPKKEEAIFICSCGYKERLNSFQERRKREGGQVSKKEVSNYLKKQEKETKEPINLAFAEAFAKLKIDQK